MYSDAYACTFTEYSIIGSGGSRTEYLGGPKVGVVSFNESGQTFESKKCYLIAKVIMIIS